MLKLQKRLYVINYHRLGEAMTSNPFHKLHTVSFEVFKRQINILLRIGKPVSLEDLENSRISARISFIISFDDVSSSILDAIPWLESQGIHYLVAPSVTTTNSGFGVRDKVYIIEKFVPIGVILGTVKRMIPNLNEQDFYNFSFYHFSKNFKYDPYKMEEKVINPLFSLVDAELYSKFCTSNYLNWEQVAQLNQSDFCTVVNHGYNHYNYSLVKTDDLLTEIRHSDSVFMEKIGDKPDYFALPFGSLPSAKMQKFTDLLKSENYRGILTVSNEPNYLNSILDNFITINRIHAPQEVLGLIRCILR